MKKNLIIQVPNSVHWTDEEKNGYVKFIEKKFSNYCVTIIFNNFQSDNQLTVFQVLEYPKSINIIKNFVQYFKYIFSYENK